MNIRSDEFVKIAPYLHNYFVLVGFIVFLVVGISLAILQSRHLARLSKPETSKILLATLKYALVLAVFSIASGLAYTAYQGHQATRNFQNPPGRTQQQAGDCSANVNGNSNSTTVDCSHKAGAK